ncbi:response regulator transcription factor [Lacticaseibacillus rhamnosus]|uniref:response regulator transcription factor n=1 Tax=Lacticaseibacillus rhamnosus TaxID=47715 RepID=UPI001013C42D|nr:response regulator transcription factor [Lacticaseibacillus rhamnosus]MBB1164292.1 response regulator transcription factor [Lacticaseibacillus rhamnosus]MCZ2731930.1 response regulator transcription factor [Lacticaseibacillus rhamnosus]MCZ2734895.1 response regulator transcription factor [Lacticaseibacillus rhamnosus]MCZ2741261.1 response regulator transcription factor [Lacticaseibacillus rhamnosus]MCZ2743689.1 response regulator transcription factor [Lacticaseibacillus rhamnosus]
MPQKIFIVEDDDVIAKTIGNYLNRWAFTVELVQKFDQVDAEIRSAAPDLVIMDISLPYFNGFHWLSELRKHSKVPVIFLTSSGDDMNLVMAMNLGADDFLAKPIELPVLLAKIQGMLRRTYQYQQTDTNLNHGEFTLVPTDNQLRSPTQVIDLTPTETKLLSLLFGADGEVVTREAMIEKLWEGDEFIDRNALAVNMNRLRKKVAPVGLNQLIETVKGKGYRLANKEGGHD